MKFDIETLVPGLIRLADLLDAKAGTAEALVKEFETTGGRATEALIQERLAASAREYALMAREAARRLREKTIAKARGFTAPTIEEVVALAAEKYPAWPAVDIESWWSHFASVGWRVGSGTGKPMLSWQHAAGNGYRNWLAKHPGAEIFRQRKAATERNGDPQGWEAFLKAIRRPYEQHKYAMSFLHRQFEQRRAIEAKK